MLIAILFLVIGLVLLGLGGDWLVRGASRLAALFGLSPLVIGLTVVAFGTSAPEGAVSVVSAFGGQTDIAIGNVVGSNIINILVVIGLTCLIRPIDVQGQLIKIELPVMIGASFLMTFFCLNGSFTRLEGGISFMGILAYTFWAIHRARRASKKRAAAESKGNSGTSHDIDPALIKAKRPVWLDGLMVLAGTAILVLGSRLFVDGASTVAAKLGVSELVIGLTVVAFGTSLPELATSIVASLKNEGEIAVGNAIGSNIYNIFAVLGLTGLVAPEHIPVVSSVIQLDLPVMLFASLICLPIFIIGKRINRVEAGFMLLVYAAYLTWTIMNVA